MTDQPQNQPKKPYSKKDVWLGIGILALLHLLISFFPDALFMIGIAQIVYLIPALIIAYVKKREGIAQGLLIGAGITFLVNAACFGIVLFMLSGTSFH
ncbi:MAG: hypothetical protein ACM32O_04990 [Clostridia bacterium]